MTEALFQRDGDLYLPTPACGSPWSPGQLHGGPVVGLMAHAVEQASDNNDLHLSRLTVDLLRAVPNAPLTVTTRLVRGGKRLQILEASLFAGEAEVTRASALFLENRPVTVPDQGNFNQQSWSLRPGQWRPALPKPVAGRTVIHQWACIVRPRPWLSKALMAAGRAWPG